MGASKMMHTARIHGFVLRVYLTQHAEHQKHDTDNSFRRQMRNMRFRKRRKYDAFRLSDLQRNAVNSPKKQAPLPPEYHMAPPTINTA